VIEYRPFRNTDPPALVAIWNEVFTGRGAVRLAGPAALEFHVFSKPYFDPAGLILAVDEGRPIGFVHAGFGPDRQGSALCTDVGVTCALGVRLTHQRRGIGCELLRRSESYLQGRGVRELRAGPRWPFDPFYFGLYGGSDVPGFLVSDRAAEPFLLRNGYVVQDTTLVLQRRLDAPIAMIDSRFPALRRQFDLHTMPRAGKSTWWQESVLGPIEILEFRLQDKVSGRMAGHVDLWEMEGFRWCWNESPIGLWHVEVNEDQRRQGIGKFIVSHVLRWLQEQYFSLAEVQVPQANEAALGLFKSVGFQQVDKAFTYVKK
jgi:ribosomal protein S18 acetylase RimI-like enzyme